MPKVWHYCRCVYYSIISTVLLSVARFFIQYSVWIYVIYLSFSQSQAIEARDAIAKFIYSSLFEWLVQQINKSLEVGEKHTQKSICILDIYGFQSFQVCNLYYYIHASNNVVYVLIISCFSFSEEQIWTVLYKLCQWEASTTF